MVFAEEVDVILNFEKWKLFQVETRLKLRHEACLCEGMRELGLVVASRSLLSLVGVDEGTWFRRRYLGFGGGGFGTPVVS